MHVQLLTQCILEVCLLIRPSLFNRVSSWFETLQNDSWVPKDHFWKSRPKLLYIFIVKFDTTMPKMVRIAQFMIL